jgi:hypothetical protein
MRKLPDQDLVDERNTQRLAAELKQKWNARFPLLMAAFEGADPFTVTVFLVSGRHFNGAAWFPNMESLPVEFSAGRNRTEVAEIAFEHITAIAVKGK